MKNELRTAGKPGRILAGRVKTKVTAVNFENGTDDESR
jgi:hypothetical protein